MRIRRPDCGVQPLGKGVNIHLFTCGNPVLLYSREKTADRLHCVLGKPGL
jgi:hypothetical protein